MTVDTHGRPPDDEAATDFILVNEFAEVRVRKVFTHNGERLEISSARLGHRVRLDPLECEALTWQTPEFFSRLLEQPYGDPKD